MQVQLLESSGADRFALVSSGASIDVCRSRSPLLTTTRLAPMSARTAIHKVAAPPSASPKKSLS